MLYWNKYNEPKTLEAFLCSSFLLQTVTALWISLLFQL